MATQDDLEAEGKHGFSEEAEQDWIDASYKGVIEEKDLPPEIARDSELFEALCTHKADPSAHHVKSTPGVTIHGDLLLLNADDHPQYHTNARGDARYLYRENVAAFTPDGDYEPATKKYVDDNVGAATLAALTDVVITGPSDLDLLQYDVGTGKWVDRSLAEAGVAAAAHNHNLADLTEKAHASLTDVTSGQHHVRYADSEAITAAETIKLDDFAAPEDNTDLNASTVQHGLLLKLGGGTANFLRADGTWATPSGTGPGAAFKTIAGITNDVVADQAEDTLTLSSGTSVLTIVGTAATDTITFTVDVNALAADGSPDGAADYVMTYDTSASLHKKVLLNNLPGGGAHASTHAVGESDTIFPADPGADKVLQWDDSESALAWVDAGAPGAHTHDGDTLQFDGINSDGGAFSFATTGTVAFNQLTEHNAGIQLDGDIKTDRWASSDLNTFIGVGVCGAGNLTGLYNTGFGYRALYSIAAGQHNFGLGFQAGYAITTGDRNTIIGSNAARYSNGSYNTCIGSYCALGATGQNFSYNTFVGYTSGYGSTTASHSVAMGYRVLYFNLVGGYNVCIGESAGDGALNQSHSNNTFVGYRAGYAVTTGGNSVLVGYRAGYSGTTAFDNAIIGVDAGYYNTGSNNVYIGRSAAHVGTSAVWNVAVGDHALYYNVEGDYNVCVGGYAGYGVTGQSHNNDVFVGYNAGRSITTGGSNVAVGYGALYWNAVGVGNIAIGSGAGSAYLGNYLIAIGYQAAPATTGVSNLAIGLQALKFNVTGINNICIGYQAGYGVVANSFSSSVMIGYRSGFYVTTGGSNLYIGMETGYSTTTANNNVAIGWRALYANQTNAYNIGIGLGAAQNMRGGEKVTVIGYQGNYYNVTGNNGIAIGYRAGHGVSGESHSNNTFIGFQSGFAITTGSNNVCIGYQTGDILTTGASNIIIGYDVDPLSGAAAANELNIGNLIYGNLSTKLLDVRGSVVFNEDGADYDFRVEGDTCTNLLHVNAGVDSVGMGSGGSSAYRLYVSVPAGTSMCTCIYASCLSTGTYNRGATLMALGAGQGNEGVWARATGGTAHNWHFTDYSGNYSDTTAWHDVSDPARKSKIRDVTKKDSEKFYDLLDKLHLKGYYYKQEKKEKNWTAPERFGLMANDPDLPDFLTSKDRKGMAAGHIATYLVGVIQYQKELIADLEKRITKMEA